MKIYQTNAGLGFNELAYLIRLEKSENGYDYLCVGLENTTDNEMYSVGEIVKDLDDFYVEVTADDISINTNTWKKMLNTMTDYTLRLSKKIFKK